MVRGKQFMTWGLCGVLSLTAIACRGGKDTAVEVPPAGTDQPLAVEPTTPAPGTTPSPTPSPTASPTPTTSPAPAQPGVTGTVLNPPQASQLIAAQPEARINLRSQPSTDSPAKGYGLVGDPVMLLRSTQGSDGTWYYVKFEKSGAEGWIRSDFINTAGRATPLAQRASQSSTCEGLMEGMVFTAYYDANGFNLVRFTNLETRSTFDGTLSRQGSSNQGQPLYRGTMSPPAGGSYPVEVTDLSGGTPRSGSQVAVNYASITGTGTCK